MSQNLPEGLHVTRWGSGSPVLLIHGGPQGGPNGGETAWGRQRPLADEGWELVLPDRPGHARSPSQGPENIEREAVWVAELLGDGMHLVGHSYGGCIATQAASLRPEAEETLAAAGPEIAKLGLGNVDDARLKRSIDILVEANGLTRTPKEEEIFTRAFLPPAAELPKTLF